MEYVDIRAKCFFCGMTDLPMVGEYKGYRTHEECAEICREIDELKAEARKAA